AAGAVRRQWRVAVEVGGDLQQVVGGQYLQAGSQAGFFGIGPGYQQGATGGAGGQGRRQHALYRAQRAGQRQFAQTLQLGQGWRGNLAAGSENAQSDGQIETAAILGQIGGGEVESDAPG